MKLYILASLNKYSIAFFFFLCRGSIWNISWIYFLTGSVHVLCFGYSMRWLLCSILRENLWGMLTDFIPLLKIHLENIRELNILCLHCLEFLPLIFFGLSGFQVIWAFQQKSNLRSGHIGPPGHIWRKIERFKVISWQNPFLNTWSM